MKLFLAIEVSDLEDAHWRLKTLRVMAPEVAGPADRYCIGTAIGVGTAAGGFQPFGEQFETPLISCDDADVAQQ